MTSAAPRQRRHDARRRQLLDTALQIAEEEGWTAVTTRRLADAIGFTQPVVYQHFATLDDLIRTVVREGFASLTATIERAGDQATDADALIAVCHAYLEFGTTHPQLYAAMFTDPTELAFDRPDTPGELRAAFDALRSVVAPDTPDDSPETASAAAASELLWACCHGLVTLATAGRIAAHRLDLHINRVVVMARAAATGNDAGTPR